MSIKINIGTEAKEQHIVLELDIRKSLSGDFLIFDHGDIDIVVSPQSNKIIAFPKETLNDLVYGAQNRLFTQLKKKGIVIPESIQGGSFFGAFEATLQDSAEDPTLSSKLAILNISKFIGEERPYFESLEAIVAMDDDMLANPDKTDSTELGEVPQNTQKGSIRPGYVRDPYSTSYMYTI